MDEYKSLKILMLTMSMGYGGAETHILELTRYLAASGYTVRVVSAGGSYEDALREAGAEHVYAPLETHNIGKMAASRRIIRREIQSFRPDIVHAHARIPAFVATG
ncbi:hypothetical protein FACS1894219_12350 [Clostridia bacterium]|nr:hypothetical protein FACS1894219_12350 [Clostridia bacterium]